jgi:hypothetical protein
MPKSSTLRLREEREKRRKRNLLLPETGQEQKSFFTKTAVRIDSQI